MNNDKTMSTVIPVKIVLYLLITFCMNRCLSNHVGTHNKKQKTKNKKGFFINNPYEIPFILIFKLKTLFLFLFLFSHPSLFR